MGDAVHTADMLIARPSRVLKVAGSRDVQGPYLRIAFELETFAWPGWNTGRMLDVEAVAADLWLRAASRELTVGLCPAVPGSCFRPPSVERDKTEVAFLLRIDGAIYEQLEAFRSGNDLILGANLVFRVHVDGRGPTDNLFAHVETTCDLPGKKWTSALTAAGFDEHLWIDVPLSGRPSAAAAYVRDALAARNRGHSDVCVSTARLAVDAMPQSGFGGRLPKDVHEFLTKNSSRLTRRERVAVLRTAIQLLLSPAHHGDRDVREEFSRTDATTALALVGSLASLMESLGPEPKDPAL